MRSWCWFQTAAVVLVLAVFALPAHAAPLRLLVLGDSLSAGHGLAADEAFPERLQARLRKEGYDVTVVNGGVSGDTSSDGLARLDWVVTGGIKAVIVELGANDALRGIDPAVTEAALGGIVKRLKARGIAVMLAGMLAPPNMGKDYAKRFDAIYPALAQRYHVPLYPFFLAGVAAQPGLNQKDGMHPTAKGVKVIVDNILPAVKRFIATAAR